MAGAVQDATPHPRQPHRALYAEGPQLFLFPPALCVRGRCVGRSVLLPSAGRFEGAERSIQRVDALCVLFRFARRVWADLVP